MQDNQVRPPASPIPSLYGHETDGSHAAVFAVVANLNAMFVTQPVATGPWERVMGLVLRLNAELAALPEPQREAAARMVAAMVQGARDGQAMAQLRQAEPAGCA